MELTANVWPVVDSRSGFVFRYFIRAYAMEATDDVIDSTLRALAPTDFRMGKVFPIPKRFSAVSEHGTLTGCVTIHDFHTHKSDILEPAFKELEKSYAPVQGVIEPAAEGPVTAIALVPRFPNEPYLIVTSLIEMPNGHLVPQLSC